MRALILERDHGGHRLGAVRALAEALLGLTAEAPGLSITLATTAAARASDEYREQLAGLAPRLCHLELAPFDLPAPPLAVARAKLADWRALVGAGGHDHVYVPYGDGLVQLLGLARAVPGLVRTPPGVVAEALQMRGAFAYPGASAVTRRVALHGLRHAPFERVHLIDPVAYDWLGGDGAPRLGVAGARVRLMPDAIAPAPDLERETARRRLGLPAAGRWVGCVGRIDERKGLDALVRAFASAAGPDERMLLAGRHSDGLRALVGAAADARIVSIDRYVDDVELDTAVAALDLVAAPYPGFVGSASVVLRAAAAGRPSLTADTGWMGHVVPRFGLGRTCRATSDASLAAALRAALDETPVLEARMRPAPLLRYLEPANLEAHWTALLRERLGLAPDPRRLDWPAPTVTAGSGPDAADARGMAGA